MREHILYILEDSTLDVPYKLIKSEGGDRYRVSILLINHDKYVVEIGTISPILGNRYTTIYMDMDLAHRSLTIRDIVDECFRPAACIGPSSSFRYI